MKDQCVFFFYFKFICPLSVVESNISNKFLIKREISYFENYLLLKKDQDVCVDFCSDVADMPYTTFRTCTNKMFYGLTTKCLSAYLEVINETIRHHQILSIL